MSHANGKRLCLQFPAEVKAMAEEGTTLWLDPNRTSFGIYSIVHAASSAKGTKRTQNGAAKKKAIKESRSPVQIAKAVKVLQHSAMRQRWFATHVPITCLRLSPVAVCFVQGTRAD
jgi:hypothetical protein